MIHVKKKTLPICEYERVIRRKSHGQFSVIQSPKNTIFYSHPSTLPCPTWALIIPLYQFNQALWEDTILRSTGSHGLHSNIDNSQIVCWIRSVECFIPYCNGLWTWNVAGRDLSPFSSNCEWNMFLFPYASSLYDMEKHELKQFFNSNNPDTLGTASHYFFGSLLSIPTTFVLWTCPPWTSTSFRFVCSFTRKMWVIIRVFHAWAWNGIWTLTDGQKRDRRVFSSLHPTHLLAFDTLCNPITCMLSFLLVLLLCIHAIYVYPQLVTSPTKRFDVNSTLHTLRALQ